MTSAGPGSGRGRWVAISVAVAALGVGGWMIKAAFDDGSHADGCALALEVAAKKKDRAFLDGAIPSPSVRERFMAAAKAELVYVRPGPDGARLGFALSTSETATKAELLRLSLDPAAGCRFLQDDEGRTFTR